MCQENFNLQEQDRYVRKIHKGVVLANTAHGYTFLINQQTPTGMWLSFS